MIINEQINEAGSYNVNIIKRIFIIITIIVAIILFLGMGSIIVFVMLNNNDNRIKNGIYIKEMDVSGLTKDEATERVEEYLNQKSDNYVMLNYKDYNYYVPVEQFKARFDVEKAIEEAYSYGRTENVLTNITDYMESSNRHIIIEPELVYSDEELTAYLQEIEKKLPDQLVEPSYYIDDNELIITNGKIGAGININNMKSLIIDCLKDLSYKESILEISTYDKLPNKIDINQIRTEIYQEPKNAYFTTNPYMVYPQVVGVDLGYSIEDINNMLSENNEEYEIPLKITNPDITTNDIGIEAFPNKLAGFETYYYESNVNRSTNLRLAAEKINGTVLMPGEVFSYNQVVGKRTEAAGFKNAAIYSDGGVTDGLGGGICQISTTLYNAAVMADLEIVYRTNHMFAPSYVPAGMDATVAYGSIDFKFKNSREYPIKIIADASGGVASVEIYGLARENEYDISIEAKTVRNSSYQVVDSYKVYRQNGEVVDREFLYTDTYNKH